MIFHDLSPLIMYFQPFDDVCINVCNVEKLIMSCSLTRTSRKLKFVRIFLGLLIYYCVIYLFEFSVLRLLLNTEDSVAITLNRTRWGCDGETTDQLKACSYVRIGAKVLCYFYRITTVNYVCVSFVKSNKTCRAELDA